KRLVRASPAMRLAKGLRPRPICEIRLRAPDRMGGIEHMIVAFRAFQQVEDDEARNFVEMGFAREPNLLEVVLRSLFYFEPVHGDEHEALLRIAGRAGSQHSRSKGS